MLATSVANNPRRGAYRGWLARGEKVIRLLTLAPARYRQADSPVWRTRGERPGPSAQNAEREENAREKEKK